MTKTMKIKQHLIENNSYFKWSPTKLAAKYGCSMRTINEIVNSLDKVKRAYLKNLSK